MIVCLSVLTLWQTEGVPYRSPYGTWYRLELTCNPEMDKQKKMDDEWMVGLLS